MAIEFLCRKVGMTQFFSEAGEAVPVTVLAADSNNSVSPANAVTVTVNVSFGAALTTNVKSYWSAPGVTSITTSTTTSLFDTRRTIARKRFTRLNASSSAPALTRAPALDN